MKNSYIQRFCLIASDIVSLVISLTMVRFFLYHIRPGVDHIYFNNVGVAKLSGLLVVLVFWYQEHYIKRRPVWEELRLIFHTIAIFALFHVVFSYLLSHHVVKLLTIMFWLMLLIILPLLRYLTKRILIKFGFWSRNIYIIGSRDAENAYSLLMLNKMLGYNFMGFVDTKEAIIEANGCITINDKVFPVMPLTVLYDDQVHDEYTEIVFAVRGSELPKYAQIINKLQAKFIFVSIIPDISGLPLYGVELEHFFGNDQLFLRIQNNLSRRLNRIIKRTIDIIVSLLVLVILFPILVIIALIIKISTKSSIIFMHPRIGRGGKIFSCMKFQTMYPNSQELLTILLSTDEVARAQWQRDFKLKDDPRVTKIGKFLRKTSLDELPQLINVLKGDMSLVGPRPVVEREILRYEDDAYYYKLVRPGITGLWQISGRNDIDYQTRVRLDVCYIKNWSLWYDFVILFRTIFVVFSKSGAY